jgi:hypothetical protein
MRERRRASTRNIYPPPKIIDLRENDPPLEQLNIIESIQKEWPTVLREDSDWGGGGGGGGGGAPQQERN